MSAARLRWALLGALLVAMAWSPSLLPAKGVDVLPPVDLRECALFVAAAIGGLPAWLGALPVFAATTGIRFAPSAWLLTALLPLVGALALAIACRAKLVDTTLRRPASLCWLGLGAIGWSVGVGWVQASSVFPGAATAAWLVWGAAHLATLLLAVFPLMSLIELCREAWAAGSLAASLRRVAPLASVTAVLTAVAGVAVFELGSALPATRTWASLLLLVPIAFAARRWGIPGALSIASVAGLSHLQAASISGAGFGSHLQAVELVGLALTLWLVGALLGASEWRRAELVARLERQSELLQHDLERLVMALTGAVEAKDSYTEGHLQRVTAFALEVGKRFELSTHQLRMLSVASSLHDVGKIGIPGSILRKSGPLTVDERETMARHAEIGASLLLRLEGLEEAATLVRHHQERYDGRRDGEFPGYPMGLSGEQIPLGARIIAVVDAFDAMTSDRPYRAAISAVEAVAVLRAERGAQFDPRVVDAFLEILSTHDWVLDGPPRRASA